MAGAPSLGGCPISCEMLDWSRSGSGLRHAQEETRHRLVGLLRHAKRDSGGRPTHYVNREQSSRPHLQNRTLSEAELLFIVTLAEARTQGSGTACRAEGTGVLCPYGQSAQGAGPLAKM
jgi:hypothetical protein